MMSDAPEPTAEEIVAILFRAAMSGDRDRYAAEHDLDPKLLEMWTFTHSREYIAHLENLLRMMRTRAAPQ
jgi:hypothetical protein